MRQREVDGEMLRPKNAAACEAAASELRHQCCGVRATASMRRRESGVNAAACTAACGGIKMAACMRRREFGGINMAS